MPRKGYTSTRFKKPGAFGKQEGRKPLSQIREEVQRQVEELQRQKKLILTKIHEIAHHANTGTITPSEKTEHNKLAREFEEIEQALKKYHLPEKRIRQKEERTQKKAARLSYVIQRINKIKTDLRYAQIIKAYMSKPEKAKLERELIRLENEQKRLQEAMIRKAGE